MWILSKHPKAIGQNVDVGSLEFYLLEGREYVVGRKDCDIVIPGDVSVSRKHAILKPLVQDKGSLEAPKIHLTDTSKTGILVNGGRLDNSKQTHISDKDIICFGKMQNKFKFSYVPFGVLTSCVTGREDKAKVRSLVKKLGGRVYSDWCDSVTHLVMGKLTFTMKVVNALASEKPIVSIKYLEELFDCCDQKKGKKLPDASNFLPSIAEANLMSKEYLLQPDANRRSLFVGKCFISMVKAQYDRMRHAVELSGGIILLKEKQDKTLFAKLSSQQTLLLFVEKKDRDTMSSKQAVWCDDVYQKVESHNLRTIRETEVGLAILNKSLQCYCNPAGKEALNLSQAVTDTMQLDNTQMSQTQTQPLTNVIQRSKQHSRKETADSGSSSEKEKQESDVDSKETIVEETQQAQISRKRLNDSALEVSNLHKKQKVDIVKDSFDLGIDAFDDAINSFLEEDFPVEELKQEKSLSVKKQERSLIDTSTKLHDNNEDASFFISETVPSTSKTNLRTQTLNYRVSDTFAVSARNTTTNNNTNPFDFDMEDVSMSSQLKTNIKQIIDESQPDESLKVDNIPEGNIKRELSESRFAKAAASTQGSNFSEEFDIDIGGNLNVNKKSGFDPTPCVQSIATPRTSIDNRDNIAISSKSFDDEVPPSEEYLPANIVNKKPSKKVAAKGFISVSKKKSTVVKVEEDPDLEDVEKDLIQVEHVSLIKKPSKTVNNHKQAFSRRKVKNFKCFRKQRVKGGLLIHHSKKVDLVVYESENVQQSSLFKEFRDEIDREEEEIRNADRLFNWESQ